MKIFDLHADIGYDITKKLKNNGTDIFKNDHVNKLLRGEISIVCVASFFEGKETWEEMQEMVLNARNELLSNNINLIEKADDFNDQVPLSCILTVEGMCGIKDDPQQKIQWLYDHGVRMASLCWNDENELATGVLGNPTRGLSEMGKQVINKMNECKMIIDVSHTNEATFWDIIKLSKTPVVASHSNAKELCYCERNLTNQQIKAIALKGGLIGMNSVPDFIHKEKEYSDAFHLALHAKFIEDLVGIDVLAIGFDFMDFFDDYNDGIDLKSADQSQNFIHALSKIGFTEYEIKKIAFENCVSFFKNNL